jgi:hypothetical protein
MVQLFFFSPRSPGAHAVAKATFPKLRTWVRFPSPAPKIRKIPVDSAALTHLASLDLRPKGGVLRPFCAQVSRMIFGAMCLMKLKRDKARSFCVNAAFGSPELATNAGSCSARFAGHERASAGNGARQHAGTESRSSRRRRFRRRVENVALRSMANGPILSFAATLIKCASPGSLGQVKNTKIAVTRP